MENQIIPRVSDISKAIFDYKKRRIEEKELLDTILKNAKAIEKITEENTIEEDQEAEEEVKET